MKTELMKVFEKARIGDGCWEWTACRTNGGYGRVVFRGRTTTAHRAAMIVWGVDVPAGMEVDHLCKNIICIRPAHLRVVTKHVNVLASNSLAAQNARKSECKRGHPLSGANLYLRPQRGRWGRQCRTCRSTSRERSGLKHAT
jgi:hypothetical protein